MTHTPEPSQRPAPARGTGTAFAVVAAVLLAAAAVWFVWQRGPAPAPAGTQRDPASVTHAIDAVLNAAHAYTQSNEPNKAEAVLKAAIAEHPAEPTLRTEYGKLLLGQRRPDDALVQFEAALVGGLRDADTLFTAGTLAGQLGRHDRAAEHFAAAQALNPRDPRAAVVLAQAQLKLNQNDEAKKNLLLAANLSPDLAVAWGTLAEIALRENKPAIALQHVAKARALEPRVTVWRVIQARAHLRQNEPDNALELLVALDDAERREPGVLGTTAEALGMLKRPADAAAMYARAVEAEPARGDWALEAALWSERAGDRARALEFAKRAATLGTPHAQDTVDRLSK